MTLLAILRTYNDHELFKETTYEVKTRHDQLLGTTDIGGISERFYVYNKCLIFTSVESARDLL